MIVKTSTYQRRHVKLGAFDKAIVLYLVTTWSLFGVVPFYRSYSIERASV